jgi:hypothetical protein
MLICRYDKDANPNSCGGCQYGCIERKPATINKEFERVVKDMESCLDKNIKLKMISEEDKDYGWIHLCPSCRKFLCSNEERCPECGQLLNWKH